MKHCFLGGSMVQIVHNQCNYREQTDLTEKVTIEPIEQVNASEYPPAVGAYFTHYGLDGDWCDAEHLFGTFESSGYTLAGHLYRPAHYTATAILLHGYLNHTGQFRHLIPYLIKQGYAVAAYDLPGHGLSGGEPAAIGSFDEYIQTTQAFLEQIKPRLDGPYYAIGFSTGATILIDMLLAGKAEIFEKIILAAPLIHWSAYEQSKGTYKVYIKFTTKIPRFHRKNSSDKDFLVFNKTQDYLHCKHLSLKWVKALFDWNEKLESQPMCDREILVIQGDKDSTVEWQYNIKVFAEKLPNARIEMIPDARHELFNEAPEYRERALEKAGGYLKDQN